MPDLDATYDLGDGWTLHATGLVVERDFWTGGDTSASIGFAIPAGMPDGEAEKFRQAELAELDVDSREPVESTFEVRHDTVTAVLLDEVETQLTGVTRVHLPGLVTRDGVLLRRTLVKDRQDSDRRYAGTDITTLGPWLVAPDGTASALPFPLAVAPLCLLPDGRWLLPGASPVWRDTYVEPLSALSPDGEVEVLEVYGEEVRPREILEALVPQWLDPPGRDPLDDPFPFFVARAEMEDAVRLRLQFWDEVPDVAERDIRWITVASASSTPSRHG